MTTAAATALPRLRTHLVFGANTDVGKTVVTAGLIRTRVATALKDENNDRQHNQHNQQHENSKELSREEPEANQHVHYIKPMQCGGSDERWVRKHVDLPLPPIGSSTNSISSVAPDTSHRNRYSTQTLHRWETAASPHLASRYERHPVSDEEVLDSVRRSLTFLAQQPNGDSDGTNANASILLETAGGVLSPSAASPLNISSVHARGSLDDDAGNDDDGNALSWGWSTQADVYRSLQLPAILVGDGRLGGISCTLSALESLILRGYDVQGIVVVDDGGGYDNVSALREYVARPISAANSNTCFKNSSNESIISLPPLPAEPEPLEEWYRSVEVMKALGAFERRLESLWQAKSGQ